MVVIDIARALITKVLVQVRYLLLPTLLALLFTLLALTCAEVKRCRSSQH